MKRNGRRFRRVMSLALCAALLLPLFGCGKEEPVEPSSESAVTEAAQTEIDPVEAALAAGNRALRLKMAGWHGANAPCYSVAK